MRILHALSQTELTGSEVYAYELVEAQAKAGHQIFVVSDRLHRPFNAKILHLPLATRSFWRRLQNIVRLRSFLRENNIDVVHAHSRGACRHIYWALLGSQIPMVTTLHGQQHASLSKRLVDIYGDFVLAICEAVENQLITTFRMDRHKIEIIRNPVAAPLVNVQNVMARQARDTKQVALIGRASGPKGERLIALLIHEVEKWTSRFPSLQIKLILSGIAPETKQQLVKTLPRQCEVSGTLPSLVPVYESSHVVIASGRIAIEASLAGCEVLALGESAYEGLVASETLAACSANNFGDVGPTSPLPYDRITADLIRSLESPSQSEQCSQIIAEIYSQQKAAERIEEIYRGARLYKRSQSLPILMYHKVLESEPRTRHRTFILKNQFRKHLQFFRKRGFTTLHFKDLADFWFERRPLSEFPRRPLLLTFDDGYRNNLTHAIPLLTEYECKATIFVLADRSVTTNAWDKSDGEDLDPLMDSDELRLLPPSIEIASHGYRHEKLTDKNAQDCLEELESSKRSLEYELKTPIKAFAYAYGSVDERLPQLSKQAGYDFAVNTDTGSVIWSRNRWSLFRINVFPQDGLFAIWRKTSPWYRRAYYRKRGK